MLKDVETNAVFYDKLKYIFIEMPNFNKGIAECESLFDKWLFSIKHLSALRSQPDELKYAVFDKLFTLAEIAKLNREERFMYENSLNAMRDYRNTIDTSYNNGLKDGIEKGTIRTNRENAIKMKSFGIAVGQISAITGLSVEEIERL